MKRKVLYNVMSDEEIEAKAKELEEKAKALEDRETELAKREEEAKAQAEDAAKIGETIKAEYEARIAKEKAKFEKRLNEREAVIRQLARGESESDPTPTAIDNLNERRKLQRHI